MSTQNNVVSMGIYSSYWKTIVDKRITGYYADQSTKKQMIWNIWYSSSSTVS